MSPKIVDKEKRREDILGAAFTIFGRKGYHATTLADIARAAGIGQGTLYYYFPTKEEIFWGVYEMMMAQIEGHMRERMASLQTPQARLEELVRGIFSSFPEVRPSWLKAEEEEHWRATTGFSQVLMEFWLQAERSGRQEDFYQRLSHQQQSVFKMVRHLLSEVDIALPPGFDLDVVVHLLLAMRDGLGLQLRLGLIPSEGPMLGRIEEALLSYVSRERGEKGNST